MRLAAKSGFISELSETKGDFISSFRSVPLALSLSLQDIRARYRGSLLGPWWITITTSAMVLGIGLSYGPLFGRPVSELMPYVAIGIVVWTFLSSSISEGGEAFVYAGAMLRQSALPLPIFIIRTLARNIIVLAHQVVIIAAVMIWFRILPGPGFIWILPGLLLLVLNLMWVSLILAVISARFRDVPQITTALLQFAFFLSPIFWIPPHSIENSFFIAYNPIYLSIQSIRAPLLTGGLDMRVPELLSMLAISGWAVAIVVYNQTRRRVVHFL